MEQSRQNERPEAIVLLEKSWPTLSERRQEKLTTMAETLAFMSDNEAADKPQGFPA